MTDYILAYVNEQKPDFLIMAGLSHKRLARALELTYITDSHFTNMMWIMLGESETPEEVLLDYVQAAIDIRKDIAFLVPKR